MSFQNNVKELGGTLTAAAALGQHILGQKEAAEQQKEATEQQKKIAEQQKEATKIAKENQIMEALENKPKAEQELDDLTGQEVDLENSIAYMNTERADLVHKAEDKRISVLTRLMRGADVMAKEADIEKATKSLKTVQGKQEAIRMRIERYRKILEGAK